MKCKQGFFLKQIRSKLQLLSFLVSVDFEKHKGKDYQGWRRSCPGGEWRAILIKEHSFNSALEHPGL